MTANDVSTLSRRLVEAARAAWLIKDPFVKSDFVLEQKDNVERLASLLRGATEVDPKVFDVTAVALDELDPGRPERPLLVHPSKVGKRQTGRAGGRGALLHAIAHIEFNAIDLALDAVWRYPGMPVSFVHDWFSVAVDEARHFRLLCGELAIENISYGDFDAHDGLWAMARRTARDLTSRMALVPRVLEARGLDATPIIQRKLAAVGDERGVEVLQVLLDEEIRHVRIGDAWFRRLCAREGRDAERVYREMLLEFEAPLPKPPMNAPARLKAGFTQAELDWLGEAGRKHSRLRRDKPA